MNREADSQVDIPPSKISALLREEWIRWEWGEAGKKWESQEDIIPAGDGAVAWQQQREWRPVSGSGICTTVGVWPTGPTGPGMWGRGQGATRGFPLAGLSAGWMEVLCIEMGLVPFSKRDKT